MTRVHVESRSTTQAMDRLMARDNDWTRVQGWMTGVQVEGRVMKAGTEAQDWAGTMESGKGGPHQQGDSKLLVTLVSRTSRKSTKTGQMSRPLTPMANPTPERRGSRLLLQ